MAFTPVILIHTLAAIGAIVIGDITLRMRKGTPPAWSDRAENRVTISRFLSMSENAL